MCANCTMYFRLLTFIYQALHDVKMKSEKNYHNLFEIFHKGLQNEKVKVM